MLLPAYPDLPPGAAERPLIPLAATELIRAIHAARPEWQDGSACTPATAHLFTSDAPLPAERRRNLDAAREICLTCPVRRECFLDAMSKKDRFYTWAGMTSAQRQHLRAQPWRYAPEDFDGLAGIWQEHTAA